MSLGYAQENFWCDKSRYDDAECQYYEKKFDGSTNLGSLATKIAKAREDIQNTLASNSAPAMKAVCPPCPDGSNVNVIALINKLQEDNRQLFKRIPTLESKITELSKRLATLESGSKSEDKSADVEEDEDDDVDLFGSDESEDEDAARVREERLKAYADKKTKKPGPIAKSSVLLDCKPWDDETDMKEMEKIIRNISMDGLVWAAAKLVPLAYGIQKLSILCIVEDEKVSIDDLCEKITEFDDYVQSVDIGAFNKI